MQTRSEEPAAAQPADVRETGAAPEKNNARADESGVQQQAAADASGVQQHAGADATRDKMLLDEVRAQLERNVAHSTLLSVTVRRGRVIVSGPVRSGESDEVERSLRSVAGLSGFQLSITEYQEETEMPGLQAQKIWEEQYS